MSKETFYCSFCGKSQHEVRKLIAGPKVFICNECVAVCSDMCAEDNGRFPTMEQVAATIGWEWPLPLAEAS